MTKTQSTTQRTRSVSPKALLLGLVALILFTLLFSSVLELVGKYRTIRLHIAELKKEQSSLKKKEQSVSTMNSYIATEEGQEQIFREKYRMVKPGEGIIVVTDESSVPDLSRQQPSKTRYFWQAILHGLGFR